MAVEQYININGDNNITHQWCNAYNMSYKDIVGFESRYDLAYTKVAAEVPGALDGVIIIGDYWTSNPRGITKLTSSSSTTASNKFQLIYDPFPGSLIVYINGVVVPHTSLPNPGVFQIDLPQGDGYMMVEYIIDSADAGKTLGDTRNTIEAVGGLQAEVIYPKINLDLVVWLRRIINNMEAYLGTTPTIWIGGETNTTRSGPSNIIENVTPIFAEHLTELIVAIQKIENIFDTMIPIQLPRYYFSSFSYTDIYMLEYIEEIIDAIHNLERIILDPQYYGG